MGNFMSKWTENKNVSLTRGAYNMLVTSRQNTSTPGICQHRMPVESGQYYTLSIVGQKVSDVEGTNEFLVFPYIRDSDTKDSIYDPENSDNLIAYTVKELLWTELFPFQMIIKIPNNVDYVDIFLLFKDQEIGSQFMVDAISWDKIDIEPEDLLEIEEESDEYYNMNDDYVSTYFGNWFPNHDISYNYDNYALKITALQETSTPGIRRLDLDTIPGEKYTFTFIGRKLGDSFDVFPYINDAFTGLTVYSPYNKMNVVKSNYDYFSEELTEIKITLTIPENVTKVQSYVLFSDHKEGDEFMLHYFSFDMASDLTFDLSELENKVQDNSLICYSDKSVTENDHISVKTHCVPIENNNYIKYALLRNKNILTMELLKVTNGNNRIYFILIERFTRVCILLLQYMATINL